jgi:hypothetical protein
VEEACPPEARGALISDFNLDELVHELAAAGPSAPVVARVVTHRSLAQSFAASPPPEAAGFVFIWTRPEAAVPEFARLLAGQPLVERELLAEVDTFCADIERCASGYRYVLVGTWSLPSHFGALPVLDGRPGGPSHALALMNVRLMGTLGRRPNIFVLNAERWLATVGAASHNPRAWYLSRVAMTRPVMVEVARDIRATLAALHGRSRKLLVLASEAACWPAEASGSRDALAEAWSDFRGALDALRRSGVLLAVVGPPTQQLQELTIVHTGSETDEVAALRALATRFGLGFEEVVYLDAREVVRKRVRAAAPAIHVPDWPTEQLLYPSALHALRCFGIASAAPGRRVASQ